MEIEEISELLKHFQRDINCLMEEVFFFSQFLFKSKDL